MGRYYFDLQGAQNASDSGGLAFESDLDAFRAAERLATELPTARLHLKGKACVVLSRKDSEDIYWVSVV
jgi:hypothetical protein